jgi:hypothetical protein
MGTASPAAAEQDADHTVEGSQPASDVPELLLVEHAGSMSHATARGRRRLLHVTCRD